jgi:signal transduction histidine kinase/ActR/RegA family two-component response regulator
MIAKQMPALSVSSYDFFKSRLFSGSVTGLISSVVGVIALMSILSVLAGIAESRPARLFLLGAIPLLCSGTILIFLHFYQRMRQEYQDLQGLIFCVDTMQPRLMTTLDGCIVWKNEAFLKAFPAFKDLKVVDSFLEEYFQKNSGATHVAESFKTLNINHPEISAILWVRENQTCQPVLTHVYYLGLNAHPFLLWTWVKIDVSLLNLVKAEPPKGFLQTVRFEDLYNAAPAGDVLLDTEGMILHYNTSFKKKFLKNLSLTKPTSFLELVDKESRHAVSKRIALNAGKLFSTAPFEFRFNWGIDVVAYANVFPYRSLMTGEITTGIFLQIFDNTEQKIKQQRLLHSQKTQAMGQLAGGIAHDFNNLLTAMIGFCDLILMRLSASDPSFNDIMHIKQNANRAANLVRQLLAFSRQQTLQPKVLNISETLRNLSVLLQRLIGTSIQLKIQQERETSLVKVDEGQFEQVIINLVVNARDAISGEGEILIHTFNKELLGPLYVGHETIQPGSYVVIEVKDTGCGIEPHLLNRIFDPFFSTKAVGSGTGLGLSTVQGIINQTGGHITVDSTVGQGTTFSIYLPQYREMFLSSHSTIKDTLPESFPQDLTGRETILLVEDEDAVRLFSARALKDKGYRVVEAVTGEEGYNFLRALHDRGEKPVDLLITDVVMPVMDGPTLARKAHELYPDLKIIFMSGYAEDAFRQKLDEGEVQFLSKPFDMKELAEKTKEVLNRPSSHTPLLRAING